MGFCFFSQNQKNKIWIEIVIFSRKTDRIVACQGDGNKERAHYKWEDQGNHKNAIDHARLDYYKETFRKTHLFQGQWAARPTRCSKGIMAERTK